MASEKRIAFWILQDEETGDESVVDEKFLVAAGLTTTEQQRTALSLAESEELKEVFIYRPLGEHKMEIQQKCLDPNTNIYDPSAEGWARFTTLVKSWNGFLMKPSKEGYLALPIAAANHIDSILQQAMMPSAYANANFTKALVALQKDSATKSESPSSTSTTE